MRTERSGNGGYHSYSAFDGRPARESYLLIAAAAMLVVAAVSATAARGLQEPMVALAFCLFIALGELFRITLPGDREAAPIGAAGGLGYALMPVFAERVTDHSALQVVAIISVGMVIGGLPHVAVGRAPQIDAVARRILLIAAVAFGFRNTGLVDFVRTLDDQVAAAVVVAVVIVAGVVDALLAAVVRASRDRAPLRPVLRDELRAELGIGAAIGATGALIALAAGVMGYWALPVFLVPLLLTQFSFRRYAAIRATYLQTIRSLSRVTEVGGYTETGHARRVSQIAVAVGRELGMSEAELLELEYAALMHDIGQLSLTDPIPGGATVVVSPEDQRRIASLGAEVIRQTGVLDGVATIVERQARPYRRLRHGEDADVPLASRIIRAANAYDDLVGDSLESSRRLQALERLRLGALDYDPRVVESLSNVSARAARVGV